jgi:hypothetical protein
MKLLQRAEKYGSDEGYRPPRSDLHFSAFIHLHYSTSMDTTKRLYREGEFVRLAAENPDYEDIVVAAEDVAVQGRVVKAIHTPR